MNINVRGLKQDYSFLFTSVNNNSKNSNDLFSSINFSDYNSIKSGTYGKLLKAYYKSDDTKISDTTSDNSNNKVNITETSSAKELKEVQTEAKALRDSASTLMQRGSKSVFKDENMEKVYAAVSDFANDFNAVVKKGSGSDYKAIEKGAEGLVTLAKDYENELKSMGITLDKNNQLTIEKDTFMKTDVTKVKDLFNGQNSFAYLASLRAVAINNTAYSESNKSTLYTGDGTYSNFSTGDVLDSII